jgi:hypothetical protein
MIGDTQSIKKALYFDELQGTARKLHRVARGLPADRALSRRGS